MIVKAVFHRRQIKIFLYNRIGDEQYFGTKNQTG